MPAHRSSPTPLAVAALGKGRAPSSRRAPGFHGRDRPLIRHAVPTRRRVRMFHVKRSPILVRVAEPSTTRVRRGRRRATGHGTPPCGFHDASTRRHDMPHSAYLRGTQIRPEAATTAPCPAHVHEQRASDSAPGTRSLPHPRAAQHQAASRPASRRVTAPHSP